MLKFSRAILMAMALLFVFSAINATETKAQPMNEIFKRMDAHNKTLKSLKASVRMDKYLQQLNEHDIYEGTTKYITQVGGDPLVRIDWTKPATESLSVVKKAYVLYRPRLNQALVGKVNNSKDTKGASSALAFMNMSKKQLQANYDVSYLNRETVSGGTETWHLQLMPKTKQSYKNVELWVDGNGMPLQARVIENNNDSTTIFLSNLEKNTNLDTGEIPITLPNGVKIIK